MRAQSGWERTARRTELLFSHGNSPAARIWNEDFARRLSTPCLSPRSVPERRPRVQDVKDRR